jgi:hypothetical protein
MAISWIPKATIVVPPVEIRPMLAVPEAAMVRPATATQINSVGLAITEAAIVERGRSAARPMLLPAVIRASANVRIPAPTPSMKSRDRIATGIAVASPAKDPKIRQVDIVIAATRAASSTSPLASRRGISRKARPVVPSVAHKPTTVATESLTE